MDTTHEQAKKENKSTMTWIWNKFRSWGEMDELDAKLAARENGKAPKKRKSAPTTPVSPLPPLPPRPPSSDDSSIYETNYNWHVYGFVPKDKPGTEKGKPTLPPAGFTSVAQQDIYGLGKKKKLVEPGFDPMRQQHLVYGVSQKTAGKHLSNEGVNAEGERLARNYSVPFTNILQDLFGEKNDPEIYPYAAPSEYAQADASEDAQATEAVEEGACAAPDVSETNPSAIFAISHETIQPATPAPNIVEPIGAASVSRELVAPPLTPLSPDEKPPSYDDYLQNISMVRESTNEIINFDIAPVHIAADKSTAFAFPPRTFADDKENMCRPLADCVSKTASPPCERY